MKESKKIQKLRADYINVIKSILFTKGNVRISGDFELKPRNLYDRVNVNYYDVKGTYYSVYIKKYFLSNDKLYFYMSEGDTLSPCDLTMETLAIIIDELKKYGTE